MCVYVPRHVTVPAEAEGPENGGVAQDGAESVDPSELGIEVFGFPSSGGRWKASEERPPRS